jgi:hypothetical protein
LKKKNLKFKAQFEFETFKIDSISCEIIFPETRGGKIVLEARLEQLEGIHPFMFPPSFSFNSEPNHLNRILISASKSYVLNTSTTFNMTDRECMLLTAEPVDLKIQEFTQYHGSSNEEIKNFFFWLTPSKQLAPFHSVEYQYDGNVTVKTYHGKEFEIAEGIECQFVDYYFHYDDPNRNNVWISESVLAAEFNGSTDWEFSEDILPKIDNFLKVVSFSERRRIICYGYQGFLNRGINNSYEVVDFYRGDISIPKEDIDLSHTDTLIDMQYFE